MLWILKRTVSMRQFFEHPKHMFKLKGKKIITILSLIKFTYLDRCLFQQSISVEPPSYCYILTASETDQVMIKPNPDGIETKPAVFSELASWMREDGQARRLSCLARLVYVHQPLDVSSYYTPTPPSLGWCLLFSLNYLAGHKIMTRPDATVA